MIIIGIGEHAVTNEYGEIIITYALSSCVAVTVYSPDKYVAAMVHVYLPEYSKRPALKSINPWAYADTAVPMLIQKVCDNYKCNKYELEIKIFGGAESRNKSDIFKIGRRNVEAVNKALSLLNLCVSYSDIGGSSSRTVTLYSDSGEVKVSYLPLNI
ncbi:MAG TPA: chemotaxis protein CheD [Pseudobacteroides sp.]|uniref:chemotaxis protein CheD n=1 Tax=Pseudobacteroides sp. TaxID=1968840 RepID=UPI002F933EF0